MFNKLKPRIKIYYCIAIIMSMSLLAGCDFFDTLKEAWEDSYVIDYEDDDKMMIADDIASIPSPTYIPYENLEACADTSGEPIEQTNYVDEFGNDIPIEIYPGKDSNKNVLFSIITLDETLYKDRLDIILKDTKILIDTYSSNCGKLLIAYLDKETTIAEWYARIDLEDDEDDLTIITSLDYMSYLNSTCLGKFTVDTNNEAYYFYNCSVSIDLYDTDIYDKLPDSTELTLADRQRKTKSELNKDIYNLLEYHAYNHSMKYNVYDEDTELTVIFYPQNGELKTYEVSEAEISMVFSEIYNISKDYYDTTGIYLYDEKGGKTIYSKVNNEVDTNKL